MTSTAIVKNYGKKISEYFNYLLHPSVFVNNWRNKSSAFNDNMEVSRLCEQINYLLAGSLHFLSILYSNNKELDAKNSKLATVNKELRRDIEARLKDKKNLEEISQHVAASSRQAGMSDLATTILHDVGNVLNSLNTSIDFLYKQLATSKMDKLGKAVTKIEKTYNDGGIVIENDELKLLIPYINKVTKHLQKEHTIIHNELTSIQKNVDHIKSVIQTQQYYAKKSAATEKIQINKLVDESLRFSRTSITVNNVSVETNYSNLPMCTIDKHMVLQIMTNLVSNAVHALIEKNDNNKKIVIQTKCLDTNKFEITVKDNGIGIAEDNLVKIFSHGFTTKKTGHGFGLHSCANGAKSLGGKLNAYSRGIGQGALFTLELPFHLQDR